MISIQKVMQITEQKGSLGMAQAMANTLVQAFADLFVGRTDAYGGIGGICIKETVTFQTYLRHLLGKTSIGIYPLLSNGTCRWGAIDVDVEDIDRAFLLLRQLKSLGFSKGVYIERSKSKGYHVILLLGDWVPATVLRRIMLSTLRTVGLPESTEVFPKQDSLDRLHYGNYLNLPYFGGNNPQGRRMIIDSSSRESISLERWIEIATPLPLADFDAILECIQSPSNSESYRPHINTELFARRFVKGERRPTLVRLAGYLRRHAISEDIAVILLTAWANQAFAEPLAEEEIEKHIRGIYRRYGTIAADNGSVIESLPTDRPEIQELWR
jgi:hypothetical protein